jgi:hypothetical protein
MRKTYITPDIRLAECEGDSLMQPLSGVYSSDYNIEYGGTDDDGTLTPGARRGSIWDEE